ncbi:MAG: hypothetical protein ABJB65_07475, partial [Chloroflexota bacterium]
MHVPRLLCISTRQPLDSPPVADPARQEAAVGKGFQRDSEGGVVVLAAADFHGGAGSAKATFDVSVRYKARGKLGKDSALPAISTGHTPHGALQLGDSLAIALAPVQCIGERLVEPKSDIRHRRIGEDAAGQSFGIIQPA